MKCDIFVISGNAWSCSQSGGFCQRLILFFIGNDQHSSFSPDPRSWLHVRFSNILFFANLISFLTMIHRKMEKKFYANLSSRIKFATLDMCLFSQRSVIEWRGAIYWLCNCPQWSNESHVCLRFTRWLWMDGNNDSPAKKLATNTKIYEVLRRPLSDKHSPQKKLYC